MNIEKRLKLVLSFTIHAYEYAKAQLSKKFFKYFLIIRIKSAMNQIIFIFYYIALILISIKSMIESIGFATFRKFYIFQTFWRMLARSDLAQNVKKKTGTSKKWNAKIKQNFLLHLVVSCTSSVYFWFLIRLVSQFRTNTSANILHSKHKNIKLFGSFPFTHKSNSQK